MLKNLKYLLLLLGLLWIPSAAKAAGGVCPTGANYLNSSTNTLVTLSSLGVTSCYYVAATGSDSNDGLSEVSGHPWAHAPFMPNCSGNCATVKTSMAGTAGAGLGFIFRGGDTWHFGNSGASPYTGGTWSWTASGLSGSPIYIGVDPAWYSGGSWSRPIMNGDNPLSTAPVASCPYQTGSSNLMLSEDLTHYLVWDNFEWTGQCQNTYAYGRNDAVFDSGSTYTTFEHMYFHGRTHVAFSCSGGSGLCYGAYAFLGSQGSGVQTGLQYLYDVFDGSDSDPASWGGFYDGMVTVAYCVFNKLSENIANYAHLVHDNIFSNWVPPGDGYSHGNVYEEVGEANAYNAYYNNVFYNLYNASPGDGVCFWLGPINTATFAFNNVFYAASCGGNYINVGRNNTNQGTYYFFNNTLESPTNSAIITFSTAGYNHPIYLTNNHYITDSSSPYLAPSQDTLATELPMTHATAAADGYTSSQTYVYSPTSGSSPTVGAGTNGLGPGPCGLLATAAVSDATLSAAALACKSDTTYAYIYNSTTHKVTGVARTSLVHPSSGAWSVGAYEFSGLPTAATPVVSPVSGVYGTPITITLTDSTTGAYICWTANGTTPTPNGSGGCSNGSLYSAPFSQSVPSVVQAVAGASGYSNSANASATYTLAAVPVITSASTASGTVGVAFTYQITATNSPTSYSASGLPSGLSVNTSTGLISGTPTTPGTSSATVGATNSSGTGTAPLTITISATVTVGPCTISISFTGPS